VGRTGALTRNGTVAGHALVKGENTQVATVQSKNKTMIKLIGWKCQQVSGVSEEASIYR